MCFFLLNVEAVHAGTADVPLTSPCSLRGCRICECGQRNAARNRCYGCNQMESPCR